MFELVDSIPKNAEIKVVGVGGGGCNAVRHMIDSNIDGVHFICANTDAQSMYNLDSATVLQLGGALTKGLGAGANPEVGRQAAMEDKERIAQVLGSRYGLHHCRYGWRHRYRWCPCYCRNCKANGDIDGWCGHTAILI